MTLVAGTVAAIFNYLPFSVDLSYKPLPICHSEGQQRNQASHHKSLVHILTRGMK